MLTHSYQKGGRRGLTFAKKLVTSFMDGPITYVANMLVVGGSWSAEEAIIGLPYCDVEPLITLTTEFYTYILLSELTM